MKKARKSRFPSVLGESKFSTMSDLDMCGLVEYDRFNADGPSRGEVLRVKFGDYV